MKRFNSLAWRNIRSRPTRAGLNAIGIILGVGLIFAVTALSSNLVKTFDDLFDSLYGDTDLIVSTENGTGIVPDKTYEKIVATDGVDDATALISSVLVLVRDGKAEKGAKNQIYAAGIEPGAESFGGAKIVSGRNIAGGASETTIDKTFAEAQKFKVGDTMSVAAPSGIHELKVVGITRYKNHFSFGGSGLSQIPLPAARKIFDQPRGYSEVDIKVAGNDLGRIDQIKADLQKNLGDGIDVASPQDKGDQIGDSLKSFNVILGFFAAIAVFVGGFLILNSFSMTIAQRIREIGMLRTMGAGHRQITRSILAESLMLGIVGAILGVLVGLLLTRLLMAMISQFGIPFGDVTYPAKAFILSIGIGILATIVSAWQPARKAGRISPMEAVNEEPATDKPQLGRRVLAGVLVLLIGLAGAYAMVSADDTPPLLVVAGVGGVFAVFTGAILIAPAVIPWIARAMSRPLRVGGRVEGRMAVDSVMANTRRSAATASILMVGIAMVATFGSVASSSIATVKNQLDSQFKSDFTVAPIAQQGGGPQPQFSPKLASQLEQVSGVAVASPERTLWLSKGYQDKDTYVRAIDPATRLQVESPSYVGATPQQA
ncbi:MAG: FtsX-like permease family protein, partial [Thermoleophilaceae bacterium]|nr:FtsX-like permease family protein [Thermoleophilaceae bacterium]